MAQVKVESKTPVKKASPVVIKKAAVKKPAALKSAAAPVKKVAATSDKKTATATKNGTKTAKKLKLTPEQRYCMIAEAAYYRAERRGFVGGDTANDWIEAEAEIKQLLGD